MNIHRNDISDIITKLPDITPFDPSIQFDIFLCSLGFELRTANVIAKLHNAGNFRDVDFILIKYPTNKTENEENFGKFDEFKGNLASETIIEYVRLTFYNELFAALKAKIKEGRKRILFDVSTCSSYIIYPTLKVLFDLDCEVTIAYSEAEFYYPSRESWQAVETKASLENSFFPESYENAKFLSQGVDDVYSSNLFFEMNSGNSPSLLVAIPNFTKVRMNTIIEKDSELNKTNPDNIVWLLGEPPAYENKWRLSALEKIYPTEKVKDSNKKSLSTLYYKDTIEKLEEIWLDYQYSFHINIGSLGSKMQHLGTFLFLLLHPDVGLLLAEPKQFDSKFFSDGCGDIHQVSFGSIKKLNLMMSEYLKFNLKI